MTRQYQRPEPNSGSCLVELKQSGNQAHPCDTFTSPNLQSHLNMRLFPTQVRGHTENLAHVKEMLPATMTVGPFQVNSTGLREHLLAKTGLLVAGCFDLLAAVPRGITVEVCKKFEEITTLLKKRTENPEEVRALPTLLSATAHLAQ